jgi:2-polyprenyl-3-methyl-5-hydroxy-6-metoxy-1,4-benzoquinol methylase
MIKTKRIKKAAERIYLEKQDVQDILSEISYQRHIARYGMVRQWCFGTVVDFASGCGYGTWMISHNPDVNRVFGIDIDKEAIDWANDNFKDKNVNFILGDALKIDKHLEKEKVDSVDVLVSLETIEHIEDTSIVPKVADLCKAKTLIISFPSKKSTHFNPYHAHDFRTQDLLDMFPNYILVEEIELDKELKILRFARKFNS